MRTSILGAKPKRRYAKLLSLAVCLAWLTSAPARAQQPPELRVSPRYEEQSLELTLTGPAGRPVLLVFSLPADLTPAALALPGAPRTPVVGTPVISRWAMLAADGTLHARYPIGGLPVGAEVHIQALVSRGRAVPSLAAEALAIASVFAASADVAFRVGDEPAAASPATANAVSQPTAFGITTATPLRGDGDDTKTYPTEPRTRRGALFQGSTSGAQGDSSVVAGDLDGDGNVDLVTVNAARGVVTVQLNEGTTSPGTFVDPSTYPIFSNPWAVALGDLDGDGDLDLVTANRGPSSPTPAGSVTVRFNQGPSNAGVLGGGTSYNVPQYLTEAQIADVDGDQDLDVLVSDGSTVSVLPNQGSGTFGARVPFFLGGSRMVLGDIDGDLDLDLVGANATGIAVLRNLGPANPGTFGSRSDITVGHAPRDVALGDFDGDLDLDVATANGFQNPTVTVLVNQGPLAPGTFGGATDYAVTTDPYEVAFGDVDGDADLDIVATGSSSTSVTASNFVAFAAVLSNQGPLLPGTFAPAVGYRVGWPIASLVLTDVDRDLDLDVVGGSTIAPTSVVVLQNRGRGSFGGRGDHALGSAVAFAAALGDLDGDQDLDLVTADGSNANVLLNQGPSNRGAFGAAVSYPAGASLTGSVALGDVDGDGDEDVVTTNSSASTVTVLANQGPTSAGTFGGPTAFAVGADPRSVALGDLDGDADLDLVTANGDQTVTVLENQGAGTFGGATHHPLASSLGSIALGDIDADGDLDVLASGTGMVAVLTNQGPGSPGTFALTASYPGGGTLALGDLDRDHDLDLVTVLGSAIAVRMNAGPSNPGAFGARVDYPLGTIVGQTVVGMRLGDIDGDADLDVVFVTTFGSSSITAIGTLLNRGPTSPGVLQRSANYAAGVNTPQSALVLGDVDGDQTVDVVVTTRSVTVLTAAR